MGASAAKRRKLVQRLTKSAEPAIRWRTRVRVLGEPESSPAIASLRSEVRSSPLVARLLSRRDVAFVPNRHGGIYRYWQGSHWALAALADLGYPDADPTLRAMLDRSLGMWTDAVYDRVVRATPDSIRHARTGVPLLRGRYRRCASQQGNALLYATRLGACDERADRLAKLLRKWQWPDGGWNCSRSPTAHVSSFMETLTPLRGLAAYAKRTGSADARRAVDRAAEIFLERRMFRRRSTGTVMRARFLQLHYPLYWYYDVLGGLKGMAEAGRLSDKRCSEALDWLEDRELPEGGWPVDARFYRPSSEYEFGADSVDWGAPRTRYPNDWVTTDALFVLSEAGRLDV